MFARLRAALYRVGRRFQPPRQWIVVERDGFTVHSADGQNHRVEWKAVERITACKRDEWSTDLICLDFECAGGAGLHFVHEDLPGYEEMVRALEATLPLRAGWWAKVAHLPFAPNVTVLYQRAAAGAAAPPAS
ncbi:MAG TPA: hypothetical protein VFJ82_26000 [Longimicrobium sp.]|nr:hypothetical protein [Longimicrobium sp.]